MRQSNAKQYGGAAPLTASPALQIAIAPSTPYRSALHVQNTGGNNLRLMFGRPVTYGADDFIINPFSTYVFRDPCPTDAIYLGCIAATTFCIMEETIPDDQIQGKVAGFMQTWFQRTRK